MAQLDYAYLADFAVVQEGKLSAIGASFTHLAVGGFPAATNLSIAGRVRTTVDEGPIALAIKIVPPDAEYEAEFSGMIEPAGLVRPYAGNRLGLLFAFTTAVPLPAPGLYEVSVSLDGEQVRRLAFDVEALTGQ